MNNLLNLRLELSPGVAVRRIKNEIFFITPASAELHTLNDSGAEIWDLVQAGKTPLEIIEQLVAETDGDSEVIRNDILELFEIFFSKGILRARQ